MQFQFDPITIIMWASAIIAVGLTTFGSLWAIWKSGDTFQKKLEKSIPIVWNAVQQELRKKGVLPGGVNPLEFALDLLKKFVKLTPSQEQMARIAIAAYHESQGAPDPRPAKKDVGSALSPNHALVAKG